MLVGQTHPNPTIAMSVTAPLRLESMLSGQQVQVIRTKADTRSLMSTSLSTGVTFAGDERGGFIFPEIHPGFDAAFTFGKLITMLQARNVKLSEVVTSLPKFQLAYEQVRCPWESKGTVMRRISEESRENSRVELVDGIKIYTDDNWVLVLPDAVEPLFHVYAESSEERESQTLVEDYARKIEELQSLAS
jgi:mannose-1-phosphate guanylyltransferase/phosphomannomutase